MPSSSSVGHSSLSAQLGSSRHHSVSDALPVCSQTNTGIAPTDNAVLTLVDNGSDGESVDLDNPFKDTYLPAVAMMPTMRDMVGTYVYTLTVAAVRKHAKTLAVKQAGMNRAQLRGLLFAAVAAKVKRTQNGAAYLGTTAVPSSQIQKTRPARGMSRHRTRFFTSLPLRELQTFGDVGDLEAMSLNHPVPPWLVFTQSA
jgi:hypothetical protein